MKSLRTNVGVKALLWLLALIGAAALAIAGVCAFSYAEREREPTKLGQSDLVMEQMIESEWEEFYYTYEDTTPIDQGGSYVQNQQWKEQLRTVRAANDAIQNLRYNIRTEDGATVLAGNLKPDQSIVDAVVQVHYGSMIYWDNGDPTTSYYNVNYYSAENYEDFIEEHVMAYDIDLEGDGVVPKVFLVEYGMVPPDQMVAGDALYDIWTYELDDPNPIVPLNDYQSILLGGIAAALLLLALVGLGITAGWVAGEEAPVCRRFHNLWQEVLWLIWFGLMCAAGVAVAEFSYDIDRLIVWGIIVAACAGWIFFTVVLLESIIVRLKTHRFLATCLCGKTLCLLGRAMKRFYAFLLTLPSVPQAAAFGAALFGANFLFGLFGGMSVGWFLLWMIFSALLVGFLCRFVVEMGEIRKTIKQIAAGDLTAKVTHPVHTAPLQQFAGDVNRVSDGIQRAVAEKSQSERFRVELITNVSHDLKTPLTSIINYVDLLKQRPINDEPAQEYIEVLERKAQRLKTLTEDLVEASKASSGAIGVHKTTLDVGELCTQALGEYEERFKERSLTVCPNIPPHPVLIAADGHHLWRIVDNLLNNCRKYAMPHTRIYLDVLEYDTRVDIWVRNISEQPLTRSPEELQERFTRGDEARSSEGSGLGLSIARSLTELQSGRLGIYIDGDLFKAQVSLPRSAAHTAKQS